MGNEILALALLCIELFGVCFLLYMGTFVKTKYFRFAKGMFFFVLIGMVFKITHWGYSGVLMTIGLMGVLFFYAMSFIQKPFKNRLDYLKMIWVAVVVIYKLLHFFHLINRDYYIISQVIMFFALLEYLKNSTVKKYPE